MEMNKDKSFNCFCCMGTTLLFVPVDKIPNQLLVPYLNTGLHSLFHPTIQDGSTWSKFGARGEHGDVFLFSNLGAPDMKFVKKVTPPDFQAKNFTPSISPNFNSFSKKKHKKLVKIEKFTPLAKILHCRRH